MRPTFGQPDFVAPVSTGDGTDPSTLEIPPSFDPNPRARPDPHTLDMARQFAGGGGQQPDLDQLLQGISYQESRGNQTARGQKGEIGEFQIMPATAAQYGITPEALAHPEVNKMVAKRYLGDLLKKYKGDVSKAVAAYNAGPGNVDKGNIPASTQSYVRNVLEKIGGGISTLMGEGTAEAAQKPIPMEQLEKMPEFKAQPPEMQKLIRQRAQQRNADLSKPPPVDPEEQQLLKQHPIYERYIAKPLTDFGTGLLAGATQFVKSGGQPHVALQHAGDPPAEWQSWLARNFGPGKSPTQGALNAFFALSGLTEAKLAEGGIEAVPEALRWMVPLVKTRLARIGAPAAVGAVTSGATGEGYGSGAVQGGLSAAIAEPLRALSSAGARWMGESGMQKQLGEEVTGQVGEHLPVKVNTENMERLLTRGKIVDEVRTATQPVRDRIYKEAAGEVFKVPKLTPKGSLTGEYDLLPLEQAEERLQKMGPLSYAESGKGKKTWVANQVRDEIKKARDAIVTKLNQIPGAPDLGGAWSRQRSQTGAAIALKRLFQAKNGVIDFTTNTINQPKLLAAIHANWGDLEANLGEEGAEAFLKKATRDAKGALEDIASQSGHIGLRPALHGIHFSLPRPPGFVGNTPIWMYPPRAPFAAAVRPGVSFGQEQMEQ